MDKLKTIPPRSFSSSMRAKASSRGKEIKGYTDCLTGKTFQITKSGNREYVKDKRGQLRRLDKLPPHIVAHIREIQQT